MAEAKDSKGERTASVIYRPGDGDPHTTSIRYGELDSSEVRFRANEPMQVSYAIKIKQLISEHKETKDGLFQRVTREVAKPLVEILRNNPHFEVDGVRAERAVPLARVPDTPDGYRNYAIHWISMSMSAKTMQVRWEAEAGLRDRCGVGSADLAHIMPLFESRRAECAALDAQRAA